MCCWVCIFFLWILTVLSYVTFIYWFVLLDSYVLIHNFWFIRWFIFLFHIFNTHTYRIEQELPSLKECFVFLSSLSFMFIYSVRQLLRLRFFKKSDHEMERLVKKYHRKDWWTTKLFDEERLMERLILTKKNEINEKEICRLGERESQPQRENVRIQNST